MRKIRIQDYESWPSYSATTDLSADGVEVEVDENTWAHWSSVLDDYGEVQKALEEAFLAAHRKAREEAKQ